MLIGEYESKRTDKNRVAVPKKIRAEVEGGLILSRGYDGCLILLDEARWNDLLKVMNRKSILDISARDTRRFIMGSAYEIELDRQGRFVLPQNLKEYARLEDEIVFIGLGEWAEVWDKETWQDKVSKISAKSNDIAQQLLNDK